MEFIHEEKQMWHDGLILRSLALFFLKKYLLGFEVEGWWTKIQTWGNKAEVKCEAVAKVELLDPAQIERCDGSDQTWSTVH